MREWPNGVSFCAELPLAWQGMPALSAHALARRMQINAALLRALAALESPAPEKEGEAAGSRAWERLEAKADLALMLLGEALARDMPEALPVTLAASGAEWLDENNPGAGSDILLSLYLSPALPQPLVLPARVATAEREGERWRVRAGFRELGQEAHDWLERTVFRYHRRAIQARQA